MKQISLVFPGGVTGAALLLLRAAVTISLIVLPCGGFPLQSWPAVACYLLALTISIGFCTRIASLLAVAMTVAMALAIDHAMSLALVNHALDAVVLAMIGPGAASVDARLFGRRTLHLPR